MNRKKEYVLLFVLSIIFLAAGRYVFRIWEVYHEAEEGYQKLKEYIVEGSDEDEVEGEKDQIADSKAAEEIARKLILTGFRRSTRISWYGYRFQKLVWTTPWCRERIMNIICIIHLMGRRI